MTMINQSSVSHDSFVWFIAAAMSLSVISMLFFHRHNKFNAAPSTIIQETITQVRFATIAPPPVTVVEPEVEQPEIKPVIPPEPVVKPEPEPKPKPIKKPEPKPKKKKKPKPKPKPKEKKPPVKPKPPKKAFKPVEQKQTVSQNIKPEAKKTVSSPVVATADPRLVEQTRMTYHALLMRHIEVHKRYPRVARKRKIEGVILVSFTLLKNGQINNLLVNGKRSILKKATQNAINDALPMPKPPKGLSLPMKVKFTMNYFLK